MDARSPLVPARRRRLLAPALAVATLALAGAGSVALAADAAVSIADLAFDPSSVTIDVGDTVTWTNDDPVPHTATADGGSFDTGTISGGGSAAVTFDAAGTFAYHCSIHPQMTGTVVVQGAAATPTPPPPAPGATPRPTTPPSDMAPSETSDWPGVALTLVAGSSALAFALALARTRRAERPD